MQDTIATEFLFLRLRTFVKPWLRLDMALSILPCERGGRVNWRRKGWPISLSIESCQLRSETLLLYAGHWRPILTSTVYDFKSAADFMKKLIVRGEES